METEKDIKGEVDELEEEELNPITEVRKKVGGSLVVERTHKNPVTEVKSYNIAEIQKKIARIDAVINLWESKKAPLEAILSEYKAL